MGRHHRRVSARWLTRRLIAARNVLADPTATDPQRQGARCRLNRTLAIARGLRSIAPMKRELETDRQRRVDGELRARRSEVAHA